MNKRELKYAYVINLIRRQVWFVIWVKEKFLKFEQGNLFVDIENSTEWGSQFGNDRIKPKLSSVKTKSEFFLPCDVGEFFCAIREDFLLEKIYCGINQTLDLSCLGTFKTKMFNIYLYSCDFCQTTF